MEFEFESKKIKELEKKVEKTRDEYWHALIELSAEISKDKNNLVLIRREERK